MLYWLRIIGALAFLWSLQLAHFASAEEASVLHDLVPIDLAKAKNTRENYQIYLGDFDDIALEKVQLSEHWQTMSDQVARGVVSHPLWMRFLVENTTSQNRRHLLEHTDAGPEQIELFVVTPEGNVEQQQVYDRTAPYVTRPFPNPVAVFELEVPAGEKRMVYALIETSIGGMFTEFAIWHPAEFLTYEIRETLLYGGAYVAFLIFSFLSFIIYLALKQQVFLTYSLLTCVSCFSLMGLEGHFGPTLMPSGVSIKGTVLWTGVYFVVAMAFVRQYLELDQQLPWADKALKYLSVIGVVTFLLGAFNQIELAGIFMMLSTICLLGVPVVSSYLWLTKGRKVRLFTAAWLVYGTAVMVQFALRQLGLVPHVSLTIYAGTIGGVLEMLLLSTSMGLRLQDVRRERDLARQAYWNQLKEFSVRLEQEVAEKTTELEHARNRAEQEARTDPLTRLSNRRAFNELAPQLSTGAIRNNNFVVTVLVDIDHFKQINDRYGHEVGDSVLKAVAEKLSSSMRGNEVLARIGGEEFAIIGEVSDENGAWIFCERIREAIETMKFNAPDSEPFSVTASIGFHTSIEFEGLSETLRKSDAALYAAKSAGRNRTTKWKPFLTKSIEA